jgi:hypothetical protein
MRYEKPPSPGFLEEESPVEYTFDDVRKSIADNPECVKQYEDAEKAANRYLTSVLTEQRLGNETMFGATAEDRVHTLESQGKTRSAAHNGVIFEFGVLARLAKKAGYDTGWWDGPHGLSIDEKGNPILDLEALQKDPQYINVRRQIGVWALQQMTKKEGEAELRKFNTNSGKETQ